MSPQEASLTPAQRLLARLYRDTHGRWEATASYCELCEALQIEPKTRTAMLRALIGAGYVRRKAEGHLCLTEAGKLSAIAALT